MNIDKVIAGLHPLERAVIPVLKEHKELRSIAKAAQLQEVKAMRALQWLENKDVLKRTTEVQKIITLDKDGKQYKKGQIPERIFLEALSTGAKTKEDIIKAGIAEPVLNSIIGLLRQEKLITITKEKELVFAITDKGTKALNNPLPLETFLQHDFPQPATAFDKQLIKDYAKRRIITIEQHRITTITLTALGKKLVEANLEDLDVIEAITKDVIKNETWKEKQFRNYDVTINVPAIHGGKRHFVKQAIDSAKRIWLDMGFEEMEGTIVNTSFWNFDALFTAQDHPVREMQDTFYVEDPVHGKLPNLKLVRAVQEMHEHGDEISSKGWQYQWDKNEAIKNVLRTHTTVLSAQTLARLKQTDLPAKFFAVGKCFRNEAVDWSHLFEFNQTEGIVVDPNANFRHLLGYLKLFFKKMGFERARFRPAYFPYTEPSVEIDVFHPVHNTWFELGGAGIFRPEVVVPLLGKDVPVLAWGPGFDRIILEYYKINDIRDLYRNDVKQLREMKTWSR
ncbi:phenylalanine--tRNA ligase subunit alpha [Candidatus Woesearchaeota archaeon]|nr:phenylalanine--tRNA ligase subunit alpha [Candidatus Woesearchaeota archaeon]